MLEDKNNNANVIKEINFCEQGMTSKQGKKIAIVDQMIESAFVHIRNSIIKTYTKS